MFKLIALFTLGMTIALSGCFERTASDLLVTKVEEMTPLDHFEAHVHEAFHGWVLKAYDGIDNMDDEYNHYHEALKIKLAADDPLPFEEVEERLHRWYHPDNQRLIEGYINYFYIQVLTQSDILM